MSRCKTTRELLTQEHLSPDQAHELSSHLESCADCRDYFEQDSMEPVTDGVELLPVGISLPSDEEWDSIRTRLHAQPLPGRRISVTSFGPLAAAILVAAVVFWFLDGSPGISTPGDDALATIEVLHVAEGDQVMIYEPDEGVPMVWISSG